MHGCVPTAGSVRSPDRVKSRAVKVGDGIEARLGSVLFVLSGFNFSQLPFLSLSQISPVANPVYISW